MQRLYRIPCLPAQRIVDADDCRQLSINAKVQMGIRGRQLIVFFLFSRRNTAALIFIDKMCAADDDFFLFHHAGNAMRHHILHLRMVFLVC